MPWKQLSCANVYRLKTLKIDMSSFGVFQTHYFIQINIGLYVNLILKEFFMLSEAQTKDFVF